MAKRLFFYSILHIVCVVLLVKYSSSASYNRPQIKDQSLRQLGFKYSQWFKTLKFRQNKGNNRIYAAISPRNVQEPKKKSTTKSLSPSKPSPSSTLSSKLSAERFSVNSHQDSDTVYGSINEISDVKKTLDPNNNGQIVYDGDDFKLEFVSECHLPTKLGNFRLRGYRCTIFESESSADSDENEKSIMEGMTSSRKSRLRIKEVIEPSVIYCGDIQGCSNVLVRVHDQCQTSEVMGSLRCDCKQQLDAAMQRINREMENIDSNEFSEGGAILYLPQEGRGIGLANKIACYNLQDQGHDTVDANKLLGFEVELRKYDYVPYILEDLSIKSITLLTNNPFKIDKLRQLGVKINATKGLHILPQEHNVEYLRAKQFRMDHKLNFDKMTGEYKSVENIITKPSFQVEKTAKNKDEEVSKQTERTSSIIEVETKDIQSKQNDGKILDDFESGYCYGKQSVIDAINAVKEGKMVLVVDDENRENEGDLIIAAEKATPEAIAFIVRYSSGILCIAMEEERLDELKLPPMVTNNEDPKCTAFTVSVDCKHGTTSGISAADRSKTFQELANPHAKASDFSRPGHVFPLRAKKGGVLDRRGHTEATLDLVKLAGLYPAGVLCEVVDPSEDGLLENFKGRSMARRGSLKEFAQKHNIILTSIADMVTYRQECNL